MKTLLIIFFLFTNNYIFANNYGCICCIKDVDIDDMNPFKEFSSLSNSKETKEIIFSLLKKFNFFSMMDQKEEWLERLTLEVENINESSFQKYMKPPSKDANNFSHKSFYCYIIHSENSNLYKNFLTSDEISNPIKYVFLDDEYIRIKLIGILQIKVFSIKDNDWKVLPHKQKFDVIIKYKNRYFPKKKEVTVPTVNRKRNNANNSPIQKKDSVHLNPHAEDYNYQPDLPNKVNKIVSSEKKTFNNEESNYVNTSPIQRKDSVHLNEPHAENYDYPPNKVDRIVSLEKKTFNNEESNDANNSPIKSEDTLNDPNQPLAEEDYIPMNRPDSKDDEDEEDYISIDGQDDENSDGYMKIPVSEKKTFNNQESNYANNSPIKSEDTLNDQNQPLAEEDYIPMNRLDSQDDKGSDYIPMDRPDSKDDEDSDGYIPIDKLDSEDDEDSDGYMEIPVSQKKTFNNKESNYANTSSIKIKDSLNEPIPDYDPNNEPIPDYDPNNEPIPDYDDDEEEDFNDGARNGRNSSAENRVNRNEAHSVDTIKEDETIIQFKKELNNLDNIIVKGPRVSNEMIKKLPTLKKSIKRSSKTDTRETTSLPIQLQLGGNPVTDRRETTSLPIQLESESEAKSILMVLSYHTNRINKIFINTCQNSIRHEDEKMSEKCRIVSVNLNKGQSYIFLIEGGHYFSEKHFKMINAWIKDMERTYI